ncbi:hypothetical protein D3C78_1499190 [compost metagenome]
MRLGELNAVAAERFGHPNGGIILVQIICTKLHDIDMLLAYIQQPRYIRFGHNMSSFEQTPFKLPRNNTG